MKIGILGARGRMGRMVEREILSGHHHPATLEAAVGRGDNKEPAFTLCDVLIDFSLPSALPEHTALAVKHKKPLVIGTTGLGAAEEALLAEAAKKTAILYAPNMSLGVNIMLSLVEQVAAQLKEEFDIEIFEAHHRHKVDSPSGTSLALGRAAAKGRGVSLKDVMKTDRHGQRKSGDIGFSVFRGGDIAGEHTVTFAGSGERIELAHKATDRAIFARGAVEAARWLHKKPAGFYSMKDVITSRA